MDTSVLHSSRIFNKCGSLIVRHTNVLDLDQKSTHQRIRIQISKFIKYYDILYKINIYCV